MKTILTILMLAITATAAEWADPRTQRRDNYEHAGWLPITQYAPPLAPGYTRVRLWVNSTNGVTAFEAYEDALKPVAEIPEGIQSPILYIHDATGTNGVALVAVGNKLVTVDGWGSPRHALSIARADADAQERTNDLARARLRAIARDIRTTQNLTTNATGTTAQRIARLEQESQRAADERLRLARWLRDYVAKDQTPEDAP